MNLTSNHEDPWPHSMGRGSSVALNGSVGHRHGSDPALLSLWQRPAAAAPVQPLAWEPPYAVGMALKKKKLETTQIFKS